MKKTRPITQRLGRTKTYEAQQEALTDWAEGWEKDQRSTLDKLKRAMQRGDTLEANHMLNQLNGMTDKRFTALINVMHILSDPERKLRSADNSEPEAIGLETVEPTPEDKKTAEIIRKYKAEVSIQEIADWSGINSHKVVKILVTEGIYKSDIYDKIQKLRQSGKSDDDIAEQLKLKKSTMNDYTPYQKGMYRKKAIAEKYRWE